MSAANVTMSRTSRGAGVALVLAVVLLVTTAGVVTAQTPAKAQQPASDRLKEVGRLSLAQGSLSDAEITRSGWLILNPLSRRGYQIFESNSEGTTVQSFNLDTLAPIRRARFQGIPITTGAADATNVGGTQKAGEVVHAVDEEAGRLYLALGGFAVPTAVASNDAQRRFERVVMIDEAAFDDARQNAFAASFALPASQSHLQTHFLLSLKVTRYEASTSTNRAGMTPGKLLAVFASPTPSVPTGPFDHELVQWDPVKLKPSGTESSNAAPLPLDDAAAWSHQLTGCATAAMATDITESNYQWEVLPTPTAIYVGCQSSSGSGAVVRVALVSDPINGGRRANPVGDETVFPLSQQIADVLVDDNGQKMLLRGFRSGTGAGHTWWVFDARRHRYAGSIAAVQFTGVPMSTGIDDITGRLYSLTPDHTTTDASGRSVPVRGGFGFSDTRLEPVPPLDNVRPDMAYNGTFAIRIDPVTRRVFVRRGHGARTVMATYPGTQVTTPAPDEVSYRIFEDRVPIPEQPPEIDDSGFTTDVVEADGVTTASYLGSASGYGTRVVLTGGLRALVPQGQDLRSSCSRDDREVLVGSVGSVSVSDQTVAADAAAMNADSGTQAVFGDPVNRCKPRTDNPAADRCSSPVDTEELAFDKRVTKDGRTVDANDDGCPDRDGVNRYAAQCVTDESDESEKVTDKKVPRDGFTATVTCAKATEEASADTTGAMSSTDLLSRATGTAPAQVREAVPEIRVAHSHSDTTVKRRLGKGIEVKVDSVARGVEIAGVGRIGIVRSEATSVATGRRKGAKGTYTRTICGVDLPTLKVADCLGKGEEERLVAALNQALGSRGRARLRSADDLLAAGSPSGYRAAVQREADDLFADRVIDRDASLAVPALEITFFQGDGGSIGAARQIFHFAGAQAATSYGIACLYGQVANRCATADEDYGTSGLGSGGPGEPGDPVVTTITEGGSGSDAVAAAPVTGAKGESRLVRLLKAPFRAAAEAIRLLFNNPRELGLMAAVWALLYAPCWLGERRRAIAALRAGRAALGGTA